MLQIAKTTTRLRFKRFENRLHTNDDIQPLCLTKCISQNKKLYELKNILNHRNICSLKLQNLINNERSSGINSNHIATISFKLLSVQKSLFPWTKIFAARTLLLKKQFLAQRVRKFLKRIFLRRSTKKSRNSCKIENIIRSHQRTP